MIKFFNLLFSVGTMRNAITARPITGQQAAQAGAAAAGVAQARPMAGGPVTAGPGRPSSYKVIFSFDF